MKPGHRTQREDELSWQLRARMKAERLNAVLMRYEKLSKRIRDAVDEAAWREVYESEWWYA